MLYELIYHSLSGNDHQSESISAILNKSRAFNENNNITGCLLCYQSEFLQILEGEKNTLLALYEKIADDPRHSHAIILAQGEIGHRVFGQWSMAFQDFSKTRLHDDKVTTIEDLQGLLKNFDRSTKARKLFEHIAKDLISGRMS